MTCEAPARPDKRYVAPDDRIVQDTSRRYTWKEARERYPKLSPGEAMEQIMLSVLKNTWRTWIRGDGVFFNFITESKKEGWEPNYAKLFPTGLKLNEQNL